MIQKKNKRIHFVIIGIVSGLCMRVMLHHHVMQMKIDRYLVLNDEVIVNQDDINHEEILQNVIGKITFPNDFLSLPFVQGADNTFYLFHSYDGSYDPLGTPFLDYRCSLNSQILVMYGHHVWNQPDAMFSPLLQLMNQATYEQNKTFKITAKDFMHTFEITHVFLCESRVNFQPMMESFQNDEAFDHWIAYPNSANLIKPNETIEINDNLIVLQTCFDMDGRQKLYVIAKQMT